MRESHAVYYLQKQNLSRLIIEYLSHGANKDSDDVGLENEDDDEINSKKIMIRNF